MADVEGQESSGPLPHWLPFACRGVATFGGCWELMGGLVSVFYGGMFILTGLIRMFLALFVLIVEGSGLLGFCFGENPTYKSVQEKLSVVNYLHKAVIYLVVPLICVAVTYYPAHLAVTIVMWFASGFAGYAAYLLWKN